MAPFGYGRRAPADQRRAPARGGSSIKIRLLIAVVIILFSVVSFYMGTAENPVTGEHERVAMGVEQEIQLGLEARRKVMAQHGNLHPDERAQQLVDDVGETLLAALDRSLAQQQRKNPYQFEFHLLADDQTVNAFALPGGQVFVTAALFGRLENKDQLAGVIGHEIGHVLARHGAKRLAKQKLTQGISGAVGVAAGDARSAQMAAAVANVVNMQYGRQDELESDRWGVMLTNMAGYDPREMIGVMRILDEASGGGQGPPEFLSTHPKPANRVEYIKRVIAETLPERLPPR
ncbi:MAG: M48 family metalloprotease [Planctomycetota bacterium]|nr:M48 family metalloprotease [Planctomycetota bacterium]